VGVYEVLEKDSNGSYENPVVPNIKFTGGEW